MKRLGAYAMFVSAALGAVGVSSCGGPAPTVSPAKVATVDKNAGRAPSRPSTDAKPGGDTPIIRKMLERLTKIRQLTAKDTVIGKTLPRSAIIAKIKDKVAREIPPDAIVHEGEWNKLLGFVPAEMDYLEETMKLLEAQIAGFYEPREKTMYLADDLDDVTAEVTLAHELVHALQDQYYDLKSREDYKPGEGDRTLALALLAEGDATSAMNDVLFAKLGKSGLDLSDDEFERMTIGGMSFGPTGNVPSILRNALVAPYIDGLRYVNGRRRQGGWAAVDDVWKHLPETTEQMLHYEKWVAREPALHVPAPTAKTLGADFVRVQEDTSGELGMSLAFEEWSDRSTGKRWAVGWGGDRGSLFHAGDKRALAVHLVYDQPKAAAELALTALAPRIERKVGKPAIKEREFLCFERPALGPLAIRVHGPDLVIVAGPANAPSKGPWSSASDCKKARAWANEVARDGDEVVGAALAVSK